MQQRVPADRADRDTHRHLQRELADAAEHVAPTAAGGAENAHHERDADRIVRTRLALQQRARSARHFPAPKHGEHHRRVSRRERGTDEQRGAPTKPEQPLRGQRKGGSRHKCADDAEPNHSSRGRTETTPADMHPALEQDEDQCDGHNPLINLDRQRTEAVKHIGCDCGQDQEDPRRRHPHPFADPVGQAPRPTG